MHIVAINKRCWYVTTSNQYGAVPFTIKAGAMFAKNTKAVPPSEIFLAAAIIITYDALFNNPKHQNAPYKKNSLG
jgi:hypothetical protein